MRLWRVARQPFAGLDGRGGELAGSRWHTRGRPVVSCAGSPALAVLEVLVHLDLRLELLPDDYVLTGIEAPDDLALRALRPADLPQGWRGRRGERLCRPLGDAWLRARREAILLVPAASVPREHNALINPRHPDAGRIAVAETIPLAADGPWA